MKLGKSYMLGMHIDTRNAAGKGPVAYRRRESPVSDVTYQAVSVAAETVGRIEELYLPGVAEERSRAHARAIERHGDEALFALREDGARSSHPSVPSPSVSVTFGYGFGMHVDATTPGEGIAWPGGQHAGRVRTSASGGGGGGAASSSLSPPSLDAAPLVFAFLEAGVLFDVSANLKDGAFAFVPPGCYHATLRRQADKAVTDHSVMGMALVNKCTHMCAPVVRP